MAEAIHANAASGQADEGCPQTSCVEKRFARFPPYGAARSSPVVGWMAEAIHASAASGQTDEAYP